MLRRPTSSPPVTRSSQHTHVLPTRTLRPILSGATLRKLCHQKEVATLPPRAAVVHSSDPCDTASMPASSVLLYVVSQIEMP